MCKSQKITTGANFELATLGLKDDSRAIQAQFIDEKEYHSSDCSSSEHEDHDVLDDKMPIANANAVVMKLKKMSEHKIKMVERMQKRDNRKSFMFYPED